jgi:hypothetical protein
MMVSSATDLKLSEVEVNEICLVIFVKENVVGKPKKDFICVIYTTNGQVMMFPVHNIIVTKILK